MAKNRSEIVGGKGAPGEQAGTAGKAPLHEGPPGAGAVAKSKFAKETRDQVGQKEPGKSRGAGAG
jgi:hypothetical protein